MDKRGEKRKLNKRTLLILLLILISIVSWIITGLVLYYKNGDANPLIPDYAPVEEDKNAQDIVGDNGDNKLTAEDGGGAASLTFSQNVIIDLSDEKVTLLFQNPGRSLCDVVLRIVVQDKLIAQSGRLVPGKQIITLDLLDGVSETLSEGGYNGYFQVYMYDPETNEKSMVNSEFPVVITVQN